MREVQLVTGRTVSLTQWFLLVVVVRRGVIDVVFSREWATDPSKWPLKQQRRRPNREEQQQVPRTEASTFFASLINRVCLTRERSHFIHFGIIFFDLRSETSSVEENPLRREADCKWRHLIITIIILIISEEGRY